jgi:predicted RNase H-like HicB family nuclease
MIADYTGAALEKANYKNIAGAEPFFGEVPGWEGVHATGKTREDCRNNLEKVIQGWLVVKLKRRQPIPPLG